MFRCIRSCSAVVVALVMAVSPALLAAPTGGELSGLLGRVVDSDGSTPLVGAVVRLDSRADVQATPIRSQPTNAEGSFTFRDVRPGRYAVFVETAEGAYRVIESVDLAAGDTRLVQLTLQAGDATEMPAAWHGGGKNLKPLIGLAVMLFVGVVANSGSDTQRKPEQDVSPFDPEE